MYTFGCSRCFGDIDTTLLDFESHFVPLHDGKMAARQQVDIAKS